MQMTIKKGALLAAILSATVMTQASADEWPEKELTIVAPYSAGGTTDITARKIAAEMEKILKTPVIIENKPGAGSTLATEKFSREKPDDYTLIMASPGHVIGKSLYPNLKYDPINDFTFLHSSLHISNIMTVPADSPYNTVEEFVAGAKENGNFTFSSSGVGSSIHLSGELFKKLAGVQMTHVPFKGSAKAMPAILNGDVDVVFENAPAIAPHIKAGKVKALAATSLDGAVGFPDLPTVAEAGKNVGLADFSAESWFGILGKKDMSPEVAAKLQEVLAQVMQSEEFQAFAAERSGRPGYLSGEDFKNFAQAENEKWSAVAADLELAK